MDGIHEDKNIIEDFDCGMSIINEAIHEKMQNLKEFLDFVKRQDEMYNEMQKLKNEAAALKHKISENERIMELKRKKLSEANAMLEREKQLKEGSQRRVNKMKKKITSLMKDNPLYQEMVANAFQDISCVSVKTESDVTGSNISLSCTSAESHASSTTFFPEYLIHDDLNLNIIHGSDLNDDGLTDQEVLEFFHQSAETTSRELSVAADCSDSSNSSIRFFNETFESISNRSHDYKSKNLVLGETCCVCSSRIPCGRSSLKCIQCRGVVHPKCKDKFPKPCIQMRHIKPGKHSIFDFCPLSRPAIPGFVFHCVMYIEEYGANEKALYTLPVFEKKVQILKEQFLKGRGVPVLSQYSVLVVSACLKEFFSLLDPPFIPYANFQHIFKCFSMSEGAEGRVLEELFKLPVAIRDTLSFLMLHFQRVVQFKGCQINAHLLSKTFTPILVENYCPSSFKEEKELRKVIKSFISFSPDYWKKVLLSGLA